MFTYIYIKYVYLYMLYTYIYAYVNFKVLGAHMKLFKMVWLCVLCM